MRFHFDIHDGTHRHEDLEGVELPGLAHAYKEAVATAREIMAARLRAGEGLGREVFVVHDETGRQVLTVPFRDTIPRD
jgi:hypothetical protein